MENSQHTYYLRYLIFTLALYFALMLTLNLMRLWGWGFGIIDMGNYIQFISNSLRGDWFVSTVNPPYEAGTNRLGWHFSLLATLIAMPFYWLFPEPETLSVLHVLPMTLSTVPVYYACRQLGTSDRTAFFWALIYLFNPLHMYATLFSYQDHSWATLLFALAAWALIARHFGWLILCCSLLILAKEHYGLAVAGFGLTWALWHKEWLRGGIVIMLGAIAFILILSVIMPAISGMESHVMLSDNVPDNQPLTRYQWMKQPIPEALGSLWDILSSNDNMRYYGWLLLPFFALLPFLSWRSLLLCLPAGADLLMIILSADRVPKEPYFYHSSCIIPLFVLASCMSVKTLGNKVAFCKRSLASIVLAGNIIACLVLFPSPLLVNITTFLSNDVEWAFSDGFKGVQQRIPPDKKLLVAGGLGPFFADRYYIAPNIASDTLGTDIADMVVVRLNWFKFRVASLPYSQPDYTILIRMAQQDDWAITYFDRNWILFEKHGEQKIPKEKVLQALAHMYQEALALQRMTGTSHGMPLMPPSATANNTPPAH